MELKKIRKALAAAVAAGVTAVTDSLIVGGVGHINWAVVIGAAVAAGLAVWGVKNAPAE